MRHNFQPLALICQVFLWGPVWVMRVVLYKKIDAQALSNEAHGDTLSGKLNQLAGLIAASLSLDRSHRKPSDEPIEEQVIDKCNRQAGDQAGSHERSPEVNVAAHQKDRNAHAHHLL